MASKSFSAGLTNARRDDASWAFAPSAGESGKQAEAREWLALVRQPDMKKNLASQLRISSGWDTGE